MRETEFIVQCDPKVFWSLSLSCALLQHITRATEKHIYVIVTKAHLSKNQNFFIFWYRMVQDRDQVKTGSNWRAEQPSDIHTTETRTALMTKPFIFIIRLKKQKKPRKTQKNNNNKNPTKKPQTKQNYLHSLTLCRNIISLPTQQCISIVKNRILLGGGECIYMNAYVHTPVLPPMYCISLAQINSQAEMSQKIFIFHSSFLMTITILASINQLPSQATF